MSKITITTDDGCRHTRPYDAMLGFLGGRYAEPLTVVFPEMMFFIEGDDSYLTRLTELISRCRRLDLVAGGSIKRIRPRRRRIQNRERNTL